MFFLPFRKTLVGTQFPGKKFFFIYCNRISHPIKKTGAKTFHQNVTSSTHHFFNHNFINLPVCQPTFFSSTAILSITISSTLHFANCDVNLTIFSSTILSSTANYVKQCFIPLSFCQPQFCQLKLYQLAILPTNGRGSTGNRVLDVSTDLR